MAGREKTDADIRIAKRIRVFRLDRGVSQQELADAVGLSFQQIQKYERAVNRVSAGRLVEIAAALDVAVADFYDGVWRGNRRSDDAFKLSDEAMELALAFDRIKATGKRNQVLAFVRTLAKS
jgi:transcriptional regulator with XRE-family HTH domain